MPRRILRILAALCLLATGFGLAGIAWMIISWPATNAPEGKTGDWLIATPFLIAALVLAGGAALLLRRGGKGTS